MTAEYMATQWGAVDQTTEPGAFVRYLDTVSSLETIQRIKQRTYDLLQIREGYQILDVGCGVGEDVQGLAQRVGVKGCAVGVDCSETMLAEARKRIMGLNLPVKLYFGDAKNLEFIANTFDGCRAERVFVHLSNPEQALAEMVRVARPGARIVVYDVDWETLIVDAPDRTITRKLLNFLCDSGGSRWIGRQLRRLFFEAGLREIGVIAETLVFTDYTQADRVFQLQETAAQAQAAEAVSSAEANKWLNGLEQAHELGSFFAAATGFCVSGRKPCLGFIERRID
jgi:ubiquinone/menaquinone biosynthesis C-methylase UbiE